MMNPSGMRQVRMKTKMDDAVAWAVLGVAIVMVVTAVVHMEWILR